MTTVISDPACAAAPCDCIRYPLAYFAAPLVFAHRIASLTQAPFLEVVATYTGLHAELTGADIRAQSDQGVWETFVYLTRIYAYQELPQHVYALYLKQPYARFDPKWVPDATTRCGALGACTNPYNTDRKQVKLHFLPTRNTGSDLASAKLSERKDDMRRLLSYVRDQHPAIHNVISSTWLQNIPSYRALFPPAFVQRLAPRQDAFLGIWGQFVRWDGTAHHERYDLFISRVQQATTVAAVLDAFPLQVLRAVGPLQDFYDMYGVR